jgi:hypothetical protein
MLLVLSLENVMTEKRSTMTFDELNEMLSTDMGILGLEAIDPDTNTERRNVVISAMSVVGEIAGEENPYLNVVPITSKTKNPNADITVDGVDYAEGKIIDRLKDMDKRQLMLVLRDTAFTYRDENPDGPNISDYVARAVGAKVFDCKYYFPLNDSTK